jgi:hypothetical protein
MKLGLGVLTLINIALVLFGGTLAMMSPMMFDSGDDGKLLWAIFWSIWFLPVLAIACVFLPWLLLWLKWPRTALLTSAVPLAYFAILFAAIFLLL